MSTQGKWEIGWRLARGVAKGLAVSLVIALVCHYGLGWLRVNRFLGFLLAMGTGASVGALISRSPWEESAWIDALIKGFAGLGIGGLLYWIASSFMAWKLPLSLAGLPHGLIWMQSPLLFNPWVGAIYGALIELDRGLLPPLEVYRR